MCSKKKNTNPLTIDDAIFNSRKKEKCKWNISIFGESIFEGNKRKRVKEKSLLASFLEAVIDELKETRLQRIEKILGEELCQEKEHKQQLEDILLSIH